MGLDMYLRKRRRGVTYIDENTGKRCFLWETVAYWRKADEIHRWFIDHFGLDPDFDCELQEVGKQDLQDLINACELTLGRRGKNDAIIIANSTLPRGGFFIDDDEFDDYYYDRLEDSVFVLKKIIDEVDWDNEVVCYYCWW